MTDIWKVLFVGHPVYINIYWQIIDEPTSSDPVVWQIKWVSLIRTWSRWGTIVAPYISSLNRCVYYRDKSNIKRSLQDYWITMNDCIIKCEPTIPELIKVNIYVKLNQTEFYIFKSINHTSLYLKFIWISLSNSRYIVRLELKNNSHSL